MNSWIVVPAAGVGHRFGGDIPKQYQQLLGKAVIEHTLERLLELENIQLVVAVGQTDTLWQKLPVFQNPRIQTTKGGEERADSVRLALEHIQGKAEQDDWVLVHDVARPCVRVQDIQNLMTTLANHKVGGVLATPVSDTLKRVLKQKDIASTEDRSKLWAAQTPQMFRYGLLSKSLQSAAQDQWQPTDESAAIERLGYTPQVVEGSRDNIKITRAEDMAIATAIMAYQQEQE
ncbi:MAG: 2-C-methyl-D-erythritol 4-phosphate cytidylyltransferase [Porticoccus sp.]|nr:2-C-methyl-D-erythritol 4-phosphate cytidylyltransferase [Porticoccus sp.]